MPPLFFRRLSKAAIAATLLLALCSQPMRSQLRADIPRTPRPPALVIVDTDIGDDIDDAFALAFLLRSPEIRILGITTAWGDTALRARLVDRFLHVVDQAGIPVGIGAEKHHAGEGAFSQARWARGEPSRPHPAAVDQMLSQITQHPRELTLLALGPLTNVAAALKQDPATFHKLKRIVLMAGSIHRGYDDPDYLPATGPVPEYNVMMDTEAAQAVFASGVPVELIPLDSSQHRMDEVRRSILFAHGSPLTDALALLYLQWSQVAQQTTPTMFDPVAAAYLVDPEVCPMQPLRIEITADALMREQPGKPNLRACLDSSEDIFFRLFMPRLLR